MDRLDKLRQQPKERKNIRAAMQVLNDEQLTFSEKFAQVRALEAQAQEHELAMFSDIYSSLHSQAQTQADIELISGH